MGLFFGILIGTIISLALCACIVAPMVAWLYEWEPVRVRWIVSGASLLAFVTLLTIGISLIPASNPANHCATGTRYVEETHGAGKTRHTDWWCVPA